MIHLANTTIQVITPGESLSSIRPLSVCLLISSLEFGGAERQVVELARSFNPAHVKPFVCSLSREVPLGRFLPDGEALTIVEKRARFDFTVVFRLARLLRREKIDVVHAFLLDAEIAARLAAPLAGVRVVVASERNTDYKRPFLHKMALKITQPLFDVMIANSMAGKRFNMRTFGLAESRIEVVPNGVAVERFYPDPEAGRALRNRLGIPHSDPVIGMVASFKRQKGHDCFLRMAQRVRAVFPNCWFLIVGGIVQDDFTASSRYETEMKELARSLELGNRCLFLGNQTEIRYVYNVCNVTALLSVREGTPNVLLESMACGVPVIATDIADNSIIIQDGVSGCVVEANDSAAAAVRALRLISMPEKARKMGAAAREHVIQCYSTQKAALMTEEVYRKYLNKDHRAPNDARPALHTCTQL
jgi:glycosyltransferase involved in cell wall biosynthesis